MTLHVSEFSIEEVFGLIRMKYPVPSSVFREKVAFCNNICPGTREAKGGVADILVGYEDVFHYAPLNAVS